MRKPLVKNRLKKKIKVTLPPDRTQALATTYNRNAGAKTYESQIGFRSFWLPSYLCRLSQVLGAVNLSEVLGVAISLLRTATALKNMEAPFTSYGF